MTTDNWIYETDTFILGHDYTAYVYLVTDDGYTFACDKYYEPLVTATVNGNQATVLTSGSDALRNQKIIYNFNYEVHNVSNVDVLEIDAPVGNQTPDYTGVLGNEELYEFANYGYEYSGFWWYDSQGNILSKDDKFIAGETYTLEIKLVRKMDGQTVLTKFKTPVVATLNGEVVDSQNVQANDSTVYISVMIKATTEFSGSLQVNGSTSNLHIVEGDTINIEPVAIGGSGDYQYKYVEYDVKNKILTTLKDYSCSKYFSYKVNKTGVYKYYVEIMDSKGENISTSEITIVSDTADLSGLCKSCDGNWYFYNNGVINTAYTGMAKNSKGWWYVKAGKLDLTYTGLATNKYGTWYMNKGKLDTSYTGMVKNSKGWWYVKSGKLDLTYTGLATNKNGTWYMNKGKLDTSLSGLVKVGEEWVYLTNGKLNTSYTGMVKNSKGWWYVKAGKLDLTYTGLATNKNGTWYMNKGKLDTSLSGLVEVGAEWVYLTSGKLNASYTGMVKNSKGWWYVKAGKLDLTYTGLATNKNGTWYMNKGKLDMSVSGFIKAGTEWVYLTSGKLDTTYTGMTKNSKGWWYVKEGRLDLTYTGLATNKYGTWYMNKGKLDTSVSGFIKAGTEWVYLSNGKLDTSYTGLAKNSKGWWYVKAGRLDLTYTGKVTYNGVTYNVKNGFLVI